MEALPREPVKPFVGDGFGQFRVGVLLFSPALVAGVGRLVVCFQKWLRPQVKAWPLFARAAVLPWILLTLMTYVVMPHLRRQPQS
jgi:hypothetical protein